MIFFVYLQRIKTLPAMRKIIPMLCLAAVMGFSACSTDVDLYADYKEVPVVYGLLDARADTNYIKITRSFYAQGDAYTSAANPDSSNYPGKLDVRLVEYLNGDSIREIILDTITIHNKQPGTFYHPDQKLYYTAERLGQNTSNRKYSYRLKVALPTGELTTTTVLVGSPSFDVQSLAVNFSQEYFGTLRPFLFNPAINAAYYEFSLTFTFKEQRTPNGDSVPRSFTWHVGNYDEEYLSSYLVDGQYAFRYRPDDFYEQLTDFIGGDTTDYNVKRFITDYPIEATITACGEELWRYQYINDASAGFGMGYDEYGLIDGGLGEFSSRMTARKKLRLAGETVPELVARPHWRFKFIGGEKGE